MIHTIDICYYFYTKTDYNLYYNTIDFLASKKSNNKQRLHKNKNKYKCYETLAFLSDGFFISFQNSKYNNHIIKIKLNPRKLINTKDKNILLSQELDYIEICYNFNKFVNKINLQANTNLLPSLDYWIPTRIDYAFDIKTSCANVYLYLLKKGNYKKFLSPIEYSDSIYLSTKEFQINFYNKTKQLGLPAANFEIFRFEVQCFSKKLNRIKNQLNFSSNSLRFYWNNNVALNVILKQIQYLIGKNDFYSFDYCHKKINKEISPTKLRLSHLLVIHLVSIMKNLNEVKLELGKRKKLSSNFINQILTSIRKLNINPIAIPNQFNIEKLDNPYNILANGQYIK